MVVLDENDPVHTPCSGLLPVNIQNRSKGRPVVVLSNSPIIEGNHQYNLELNIMNNI